MTNVRSSDRGATRESVVIARRQVETGPDNSWATSGLRGVWHRILRRLLRPHTDRREVFRHAVVDSLEGIGAELDYWTGTTTARFGQVDAQFGQVDAQFGQVDARLARSDTAQADADVRLQSTVARLERVIAAHNVMWEHFAARPFMVDADVLMITDEQGRKSLGFERPFDTRGAGNYLGFEDLFRGTEDFIRARLAVYAALVGAGPVLDIGCGRGEFLEVLRDEGIDAAGIDLDPDMVAVCRDKGLVAETQSALEALEARPAGSLGAVFSAQVVEHMHPDDVVRLVELAYEAVADGGSVIIETVNPHSARALKTFWLDLTHVRPLYPEALLSLAASIGFDEARIVFPNGSGDLDVDILREGEYAIVAVRRPKRMSSAHER